MTPPWIGSAHAGTASASAVAETSLRSRADVPTSPVRPSRRLSSGDPARPQKLVIPAWLHGHEQVDLAAPRGLSTRERAEQSRVGCGVPSQNLVEVDTSSGDLGSERGVADGRRAAQLGSLRTEAAGRRRRELGAAAHSVRRSRPMVALPTARLTADTAAAPTLLDGRVRVRRPGRRPARGHAGRVSAAPGRRGS